MTERQIKRLKANGVYEDTYPMLVEDKIRKRYSLSNELAILRQRDTKPDEYAAYNEYVESCKAAAKAELGMEVQNEDIPS